jgi:hypothetical protein
MNEIRHPSVHTNEICQIDETSSMNDIDHKEIIVYKMDE